VDGPGHELLARARLAHDQHRALRLRHQLDLPEQVLDRAALADDAVVVELLVPLAAEVAVLGAEPLVVEGAACHHEQLVDLEGLLQVVEGPELHGLDRALDRGVGRHHHDLGALAVRGRGHEVADDLEPRALGHPVVHDQEVERPLREQPLGLAGAGRRHHLVALVAQGAAQVLQDLLLVVDEQDRAAVCHA
jgi:hypothetical protein